MKSPSNTHKQPVIHLTTVHFSPPSQQTHKQFFNLYLKPVQHSYHSVAAPYIACLLNPLHSITDTCAGSPVAPQLMRFCCHLCHITATYSVHTKLISATRSPPPPSKVHPTHISYNIPTTTTQSAPQLIWVAKFPPPPNLCCYPVIIVSIEMTWPYLETQIKFVIMISFPVISVSDQTVSLLGNGS